MRRAHEPNVRLVCIDSREAPILTEVARTQARRVRTHVADLDMGAALEEVSTAAGRLNTPYGRYRHLYVQLGRALAAKDLGRAERLAGEAAALAYQQKWGHLLVASWFALGAGYLSMGKPVEAIRTYWQAEDAALEAQARGESSALALRLKVRLALGAALVSAAVYERGATVYEDTAPLAEQLQDTRMLLECWRMAAYCHELARAADASWRCGIEGLKVAQRMDDETRRSSTLGYLGEGMLRLTRTWTYRDHGVAIERQMEKFLGPRWRPSESGETVMMPAAKHFDPLLGIDIHLIQPPGGVPPVPIPHPHIGMVFDPMDYVPILGATVLVGGVPRAQAGTSGIALPPHIPMGGVFIKPPANESEVFMGSSTVSVDGDAFSHRPCRR
ncbi:PAAR domain-containing protein [Cystobacter fuscus]